MYDETMLRKRIKTERDERGWTQAQLAEQLTKRGIPARWATIAKIEGGTRHVHGTELAALADTFEVSIDTLVGRLPRPAGDLAYLRRGLLNTAHNIERLTNDMADVLASIIATRIEPADPEGELARLTDQAKSLLATLRATVMVARQIIREEES